MEQKWRAGLNPQTCAAGDCGDLPVRFPYFDRRAFSMVSNVPVIDGFNQLGVFAVGRRAAQLDVLRLGPHQRHRGARLSAKHKMALGKIRRIPHLFWYQANAACKIFECPNIRFRIVTGSKLVNAALSRQHWPRPSDTPSVIGGPVLVLSETIVIVSTPHRPCGRVYLEHRIDNTQGVVDNRIVGTTNSESDQFQKARIDDYVGRIVGTTPRRLVGQS